MASPVEHLPGELLDNISVHLGFADIVHLVQCSKRLHGCIEPILYASRTALDMAVFWACKNNKLPTLRLATSYGADVNVVNVDKRINRWARRNQHPGQVQVSTLYLTIKHFNFDAFSFLLELGAHVTEDVDPYQLRHLTRRLSKCTTFFDLFRKAGLGSELRERPDLRISLVSIIRDGGSLDMVRHLILNGADIRQRQPLGTKAILTPLTAAIGANSLPLVDFLIEQGVDIHGEDLVQLRCRKRPLNIPVFAAAHTMVKHGVGMMQRCIDLGVNINLRYQPISRYGHGYIDRDIFANTPLLVYLDSIDSWKSPTSLRPAEGIAFFLKNHADVVYAAPSPVTFLLDKWGVEKLTLPEFWAAIVVLVEHGASRLHTRSILAKYDSRRLRNTILPRLDDIVQAWRRFVQLILKFREESVTINELLTTFVEDKSQFGRLEECTLEYFYSAGADQNIKREYRKLRWGMHGPRG